METSRTVGSVGGGRPRKISTVAGRERRASKAPIPLRSLRNASIVTNVEDGFDVSPHNPFNWRPRLKWTVMGISCVVTFLVGLNSTSVSAAFPELNDMYGLRDDTLEVAYFTITAWNAAAAIVPMFTLSLMDTYGTFVIYLLCYAFFFISIIPQAAGSSFGVLVAFRVLSGAFGGTLQNAAEGYAANLWRTSQERVIPITVYIFALNAGVTFGPVQGAITQAYGFRWIFWLELLICGGFAPIVLLTMKETRGSVILKAMDEERRDGAEARGEPFVPSPISKREDVGTVVARSVKLLFTELTVSSFTLWSAFTFGIIYISTESVSQVFSTDFGFQSYEAALAQLAIFVGEIFGLVACILCTPFYVKSAGPEKQPGEPLVEGSGKPVPERCLYLSIPATIFGLSGGLFVYGWTSYQGFPWIAPAIGLALQGFAIQVIVTAATIYITESYEKFAASAVGAVAFGENMFAAFLPLATKSMYTNLGFHWASSLLAFLALALSLAPAALAWKGSWIRSKSPAIRQMTW